LQSIVVVSEATRNNPKPETGVETMFKVVYQRDTATGCILVNGGSFDTRFDAVCAIHRNIDTRFETAFINDSQYCSELFEMSIDQLTDFLDGFFDVEPTSRNIYQIECELLRRGWKPPKIEIHSPNTIIFDDVAF